MFTLSISSLRNLAVALSCRTLPVAAPPNASEVSLAVMTGPSARSVVLDPIAAL